MDTKSFKLDVHVKASSQDPSSGPLSTVEISLARAFEDFIVNEKDDTVTSLGSYSDPSSPLTILKLQNFEPDYVYQLLHGKLHDHVLSEQISSKVVEEAHLRTQSFDHLPPRQPLSMLVSVTLTQKVYNVVPCSSAPLTTTDLDKELETCAICLENLSTSEDYTQMPCSHCFHEQCVTEWLHQHNSSCPLCRQAIY